MSSTYTTASLFKIKKMKRKRTKGRQKIIIKKIEKESNCFATFSKRRLGLFRKASELSTLCNIDIGLIIYSPTGKPFSFFHPTMESVISRAHSPSRSSNNSDAARLIESYTQTRVSQLNLMLGRLRERLEAEMAREDMSCSSMVEWLKDEIIDKFAEDQVGQVMDSLRTFRVMLTGGGRG